MRIKHSETSQHNITEHNVHHCFLKCVLCLYSILLRFSTPGFSSIGNAKTRESCRVFNETRQESEWAYFLKCHSIPLKPNNWLNLSENIFVCIS